MLSIVRKPGQSFTIGDEIEVYIVSVRRTHVKISILAPKRMAILRDNTINRTKIAEQDRAMPEATTRAAQRG